MLARIVMAQYIILKAIIYMLSRKRIKKKSKSELQKRECLHPIKSTIKKPQQLLMLREFVNPSTGSVIYTDKMSIPIKDTPVLSGEDARIFRQAIEQNKHKAISWEELKRIQTNYNIMQLLVQKSANEKI